MLGCYATITRSGLQSLLMLVSCCDHSYPVRGTLRFLRVGPTLHVRHSATQLPKWWHLSHPIPFIVSVWW